jgi:penicillin-binding protein 1A
VQPQDVPDLQDIPLGDGRRLIINDDEAVLSTDIEGVPLELRVRDGELSLDVDEEAVQRKLEEELQN